MNGSVSCTDRPPFFLVDNGNKTWVGRPSPRHWAVHSGALCKAGDWNVRRPSVDTERPDRWEAAAVGTDTAVVAGNADTFVGMAAAAGIVVDSHYRALAAVADTQYFAAAVVAEGTVAVDLLVVVGFARLAVVDIATEDTVALGTLIVVDTAAVEDIAVVNTVGIAVAKDTVDTGNQEDTADNNLWDKLASTAVVVVAVAAAAVVAVVAAVVVGRTAALVDTETDSSPENEGSVGTEDTDTMDTHHPLADYNSVLVFHNRASACRRRKYHHEIV